MFLAMFLENLSSSKSLVKVLADPCGQRNGAHFGKQTAIPSVNYQVVPNIII